MMLKEVEGPRHEQFGRALPVEALSRAGVELPGDPVEFVLTERGEVGAPGHVLAEQPVGVLVDAALPGATGVGEVDLDAGDVGEPFVLRHFASLIVGQREAPLRVNAIEDGAKAGDRGRGTRIVHLRQRHEQRGSLDQRADGGRIPRALDQVAFPMAGNDALADLRGPLMNAGHVGNDPSAILAPGARPAALARLAQAGDQLRPQSAARHGVQRRVDGSRGWPGGWDHQGSSDAVYPRSVPAKDAPAGGARPRPTRGRHGPDARDGLPCSPAGPHAAARAAHDTRPPQADVPASSAP